MLIIFEKEIKKLLFYMKQTELNQHTAEKCYMYNM